MKTRKKKTTQFPKTSTETDREKLIAIGERIATSRNERHVGKHLPLDDGSRKLFAQLSKSLKQKNRKKK